MSAATINRKLRYSKKQLELKRRSKTKPGGLLRSQIPIRTFADWNEKVPGFIKVGLVNHSGDVAAVRQDLWRKRDVCSNT